MEEKEDLEEKEEVDDGDKELFTVSSSFLSALKSKFASSVWRSLLWRLLGPTPISTWPLPSSRRVQPCGHHQFPRKFSFLDTWVFRFFFLFFK